MPSDTDFVLYHYDPNLAAAATCAAVFGVVAALHMFQLWRKRAWFLIPLFIGAILECEGYIGRTISCVQTPNWTLIPYVIQSLFLLIAPALFAASIYIILGRIMILTGGERYSIINIRWITKLFVAGDVISFFTQCGGGGLMASGKGSTIHIGEIVVVVGLCMQLLFFGIFVLTAAVFHARIHQYPTVESVSPSNPWRKHLLCLYVSSTLIFIRSAFRVVEFAQGNNGYLIQRELYLYCFDAVLMFVVLIVFNVFHPAEIAIIIKESSAMSSGSSNTTDVEKRGRSVGSVSLCRFSDPRSTR